jgi:hypothetical protein
MDKGEFYPTRLTGLQKYKTIRCLKPCDSLLSPNFGLGVENTIMVRICVGLLYLWHVGIDD